MSLVRVQFISVSLDGFATGEGQSLDAPFGHAGERLHEWMFATRWGRGLLGRDGGTGGVDDAFLRLFAPEVGAEIMGAGKFGHPGWHEDPDWKGPWGPNPPFHTPVFVLTHHTRPSIEMEGGTTFHFIDALPAEALDTAREAADGKDVRIGGGPTMIREFLAAGLVDHMHIVVVPILLGRGVRLWDGLEGLENDYEVEATSSPSGVTHVTFTRARHRRHMERQNVAMQIMGTDPVLAVHDLDKSGAWYRDVLGCEIDDVAPGNWRFCRAGGVTFMLGRCPNVPAAGELGDHSYVAYIRVDDVDGFHLRAVAAGAEVMKAPRDEPWGMREFGLRSPDGHRFMLGQSIDSARRLK